MPGSCHFPKSFRELGLSAELPSRLLVDCSDPLPPETNKPQLHGLMNIAYSRRRFAFALGITCLSGSFECIARCFLELFCRTSDIVICIYIYIQYIHTYIHTYIRTYVRTYIHTYIYIYILCMYVATAGGASSAAQGGSGSFNHRKPIEEVSCCDSCMAERTDGLKGG